MTERYQQTSSSWSRSPFVSNHATLGASLGIPWPLLYKSLSVYHALLSFQTMLSLLTRSATLGATLGIPWPLLYKSLSVYHALLSFQRVPWPMCYTKYANSITLSFRFKGYRDLKHFVLWPFPITLSLRFKPQRGVPRELVTFHLYNIIIKSLSIYHALLSFQRVPWPVVVA